MIVVDLGCATIGTEESVLKLTRRFRPLLLFGFDPLVTPGQRVVDSTVIIESAAAAWTCDGFVSWHADTTRSRVVSDDESAVAVQAFDLNAWLRVLPSTAEVLLKLDVEGAEYPLLERLHDDGLDEGLNRVIVEWHAEERVELNCPVEEWT